MCNAGTIGGDEEKFIIEADRENELWWIPEARVLDIIHRGGWPVAEYDRIQNELRVDKALAAAQMIKDQQPYEVQDGERINFLDSSKVVRFVGFHCKALRAEGRKEKRSHEKSQSEVL